MFHGKYFVLGPNSSGKPNIRGAWLLKSKSETLECEECLPSNLLLGKVEYSQLKMDRKAAEKKRVVDLIGKYGVWISLVGVHKDCLRRPAHSAL